MKKQRKKYGLSILETIYRIRSVRYKGKGRPRKSDYDYKSFLDMQKDINSLYSKMILRAFANGTANKGFIFSDVHNVRSKFKKEGKKWQKKENH